MSRLTSRTLSLLGINSDFHQLSLAAQVRFSQAPLVLTVSVLCIIFATLLPEIFEHPQFRTGLALLAAVTVASLLVPWDRIWGPSYWILPLFDFLAIGYLHYGAQGVAMGLYLLSVFPVFRLAWSRFSALGTSLLSFACPLVMVCLPLMVSGEALSAQSLAVPIVVPLVTLVMAVTVTVMRRDMLSQQEALEEKDRLLENALVQSKERSQLLDVVLNAIDVGVLVVDGSGSAVHKNERMQVLDARIRPAGMEHTQEEDLLFFAADRTTVLPVDRRPIVRAMRGETFQDVLLWAGAPKDQMALSCSARILHNDGGFNGAVIAFTDITALVDALSAKEDFVSNVSHELRTPLTSIMGYLDLAQEEAEETGLTGVIPHAVQVAQRNSERLLSLVSDLLTAASGNVALDPAPVSVADLIAASLRSAAPRAAAAGVEMVAECEAGLSLRADPVRLSQVLDNLLSNAIKYSPDGGTVTVRGRSANGVAYLEVQDTGMGMSTTDQSELFTKFFRTGAVRRAGIPGAGLGLAISKGIVEAHGGTLSLVSSPGQGSTFTVSLPDALVRLGG